MKPRIYLAGGINGLNDDEVFAWRRRAASILSPLYVILDPSEHDFRGIEETSVDEIVGGDIAEIASSNLLLVRAERPSWGTAIELRIAWELGVPAVVWGAGDRPSPWLVFHSVAQCTTLDDAIEECQNRALALTAAMYADPMRVAQ